MKTWQRWCLVTNVVLVGLLATGLLAAQEIGEFGNGANVFPGPQENLIGSAGLCALPPVGEFQAECMTEDACGCAPESCCCAGPIAYVEWLNLAARDPMDIVIIIPTYDKYWEFDIIGEKYSLVYERGNGIRTGLGYRFCSGWDVLWNYTYFHTSASAVIEAPEGGVLRTTRGHPRWAETADIARASASLDLDVIDLEAGRWFDLDETAAVRLFGGFRWAMMDRDLDIVYDGRDYFNGMIDNPTTMDGYGIRVGAEGRWALPWGLSLFARGAGSVLAGKFTTHFKETDDGTGWYGPDHEVLVDVWQSNTRAVPVLETAAGVGWCCGNWEISAGYELAAWFNMSERLVFHDGGPHGPPPWYPPYEPWEADEGSFSLATQDLLLDGFFLRLSLVR